MIYENWSGDKTVKHLSKMEYELKSERIYISEELDYVKKVYNGELEVFVGSILNIMYCEYIDRFKHNKDIEHRYTRLMQLANQFKYNPLYMERFVENIDYMIYDVNRAWKIVCQEYFRLKEKYSNKL